MNLSVRLGELRLTDQDEQLPYDEISVSAVIKHPDFQEGSLLNDIALLVLQRAAKYDLHVRSVCLPSPQSMPSGAGHCVVSGWGQAAMAGNCIGSLIKMRVGLVHNTECQTTLQSTHLGRYFQLHESFFCADVRSSRNSCKVKTPPLFLSIDLHLFVIICIYLFIFIINLFFVIIN